MRKTIYEHYNNFGKQIIGTMLEDGFIQSQTNKDKTKNGGYKLAPPLSFVHMKEVFLQCEITALNMAKAGASKKEIKAYLDNIIDEIGEQIYEETKYKTKFFYACADYVYKSNNLGFANNTA